MTTEQFPKALQEWYAAALRAAKAPERQEQLKKELPPRMEAALYAAGAARPPEEAARIAAKSLGDPAQFAPPPAKPVSHKICGILAAICCGAALVCGALPIYRIFFSPVGFPSYLENESTWWSILTTYGTSLYAMGAFLIVGMIFLYQALRKQRS